ncbi:MAG: ethanolamine permease [Bacteriovoracia bacterium]
MEAELKKTLGPFMLWGLGVGYVISGMYFGWNLGLPYGGPFGFLIATLLVTVMYVTFVLTYAELSCALPKAGGAHYYAATAFGKEIGFIAGIAQCIEFLFAPPAIAAAIGAYFNIFFPEISPLAIAITAYFIFTGLNIYGVKHSAIFELVITVLAVIELLIFAGITLPHFSFEAFSKNPLPHGWGGVLPAIPFAIWFYLAIEGIANVAEETKNPQRDLARGFGSAMATLVFLALLTFFSSVGVNGWESVVYKGSSSVTSDSPLPLALAHVVGEDHMFYHLLITIGLCGLLASFHGIILVAGRATFEFGRLGHAPKVLSFTLPKRKTPAPALLFNMAIGFLALLSGRTSEIILVSVFGALTMYVVSILSFFKLRKEKPNLKRPFRTPFYPWVSLVALLLSTFSLLVMAYYNLAIAGVFVGILIISRVISLFTNLVTNRGIVWRKKTAN